MPKRRGGAASRRLRTRRDGPPWWVLAVVVAAAAVVAVSRLGHAPGPLRHPQPRPPAAGLAVYFVRYADSGGEGTLVSVRRPATGQSADARVTAALRALLAGPSPDERRQGLVSEVPVDTTLRSVVLRDGVVTVDLTPAFAQGGGSASMLARVWQLVYTATQVPEARAVQITLDGRRVPALGGEGLMVDRPLERPASVPTF